MPLQPKQLLQTNRDGDRLWSTDKSGAYVALLNITGWGAPNAELLESAILFIAVRKGSTENNLSFIGTQLFHNPASANTYENACEFVLAEDGHHRIYMMQLDVSDDGILYVKDNSAIPDDTYFYYDGDICYIDTGEVIIVPIEDYGDLIDDEGVAQDYAENIFFPKLMIKLSSLIQTKIGYREKNMTQEEEYYTRLARDLRDDIESAYNLFWSGLTIQANSLIESLTNKYANF